MATLFTTVLNGMKDNNNINGASFSDWSDAYHALEIYEENFYGDCPEQELGATIKALNAIIKSNGKKYEEAVNEWNLDVWGVLSANDNGPVAFRG